MFTGIIQSIGTIVNIDRNKKFYTIKTILNLEDCTNGSSICCDGVCLTAINIKSNNKFYTFDVNISEETKQIVGKDLNKHIKTLDKKMLDYAAKLEFEDAARLRDEINRLKSMEVGIPTKLLRIKN